MFRVKWWIEFYRMVSSWFRSVRFTDVYSIAFPSLPSSYYNSFDGQARTRPDTYILHSFTSALHPLVHQRSLPRRLAKLWYNNRSGPRHSSP